MEKEKTDVFVKIMILQCIFVLVIISSVLIVKYFFKGTFNDLKLWYNDNIAVDTDIYEVLGEIDEI
ncbi:MAG: hypothetical protein IKT93_05840 [Clostridia bacterium]|nr:hypothetical protein [Clostridia bacterium]